MVSIRRVSSYRILPQLNPATNNFEFRPVLRDCSLSVLLGGISYPRLQPECSEQDPRTRFPFLLRIFMYFEFFLFGSGGSTVTQNSSDVQNKPDQPVSSATKSTTNKSKSDHCWRTFGWGPVVFSVAGLHEQIFNSGSQPPIDDKPCGSFRHSSVWKQKNP